MISEVFITNSHAIVCRKYLLLQFREGGSREMPVVNTWTLDIDSYHWKKVIIAFTSAKLYQTNFI